MRLQRREGLDQPGIELGEEAGEEGDAGEHQQPAHHPLDMRKMGAKARQEGGERLDGECGEDERQPEAERIDRKQPGALGDGCLRSRDREDRRQDRPDAGRPAEREGEPHHIGAPKPDRLCHVDPRLPVQEGDRGEPEEMQAHDDDGDAGDDRELVRVEAQHRADHAGAGAERDEYRGESGDEQDRGKHGVAPHARRRLRIGEPLERRPRQIDQIGRHQRQHAGREKAHQPGEQRGKDGDVGGHDALMRQRGGSRQAARAAIAGK